MVQQAGVTSSQPCVWMCAGHISYRLCTRDFDCEHCPLDAALRGENGPAARHGGAIYHRAADETVPNDRLYSTGHTWALPLETPARWRIGIDAFAAALVGCVVRVSCDPHEIVAHGDVLCSVDLGIGALRINAPFGGRILQQNAALSDHPDLVVSEPFDGGWIVEISPAESVNGFLLSPDAARRQLALDLREFRRAIAFRLLASADGKDVFAGGLSDAADLRTVLSGADYVQFIRDFVH